MKQECPTYFKTIGKSKALATILSDIEPEDDFENEDDGILNSFTATVNPTEGIVEDVARNLWGEAVNIACHAVNRVYFKPVIKKTPYKLWKGRKPNVKYFRIFGSTCFILKDRENVGKFDFRSDEGIFLGYSFTSKAYWVYNKRTKKVMETVNVVIDKTSKSSFENISEEIPKEILPPKPKDIQEFVDQEPASPSTLDTPSDVEDLADISTSLDSESHKEKGPSSRIKLNHPLKVIVGNMNELILRKCTIDKCVANFVSYSCYLLQVKPTKVEEAFRMKAGWKLCMMNCFSFKGMMSGL